MPISAVVESKTNKPRPNPLGSKLQPREFGGVGKRCGLVPERHSRPGGHGEHAACERNRQGAAVKQFHFDSGTDRAENNLGFILSKPRLRLGRP